MVRFEGQVMTEVKYLEIMQERKVKAKGIKRNPVKAVNSYFFGREKVTLTDSLYFYGTLGVMLLVSLMCIVIKFIN